MKKILSITAVVLMLASCKSSFYTTDFKVVKVEQSRLDSSKKLYTLQNTGYKKIIPVLETGKYSYLQDSAEYKKGDTLRLTPLFSGTIKKDSAEKNTQFFTIDPHAALLQENKSWVGGFIPKFTKHEVPIYVSEFIAGVTESLKDAIVTHDPFPNSQYWSLAAYKNLYNGGLQSNGKGNFFNVYVWPPVLNGYHLMGFTSRVSQVVAAGFSAKLGFSDFKSLTPKRIIGIVVTSFFVYQAGYVFGYNVLFK